MDPEAARRHPGVPVTRLIDPEKGDGKLADHITGETKRVLIVFWHGVGDVVMFRAPLQALRGRFPWVTFDLGLCAGLDEETFVPDAVLLGQSWRSDVTAMDYDIVFLCHFPVEQLDDLTLTKAEQSCIVELGIEPTHGHLPITPKPLVGLHFHATSMPWAANADQTVARLVWEDVLAAGCVPIETHFEHVFHNPVNGKFDFVDYHVRGCRARLDNLIALLGGCRAFVGVVSGNFHLALSILGPDRVMLLERALKAPHFTKHRIATADLDNYRGEVRAWLASRTS